MDDFDSTTHEIDKIFNEVYSSTINEMLLNVTMLQDSVLFSFHEKKDTWLEDTGAIQFTFRLSSCYTFELKKTDIYLLYKAQTLADFLMQRASNFLATFKKKDSNHEDTP